MQPLRPLLAIALVALTATVTPVRASIRVYDVDPAYRQEMLDVLSEMLDSQNGNLYGRVQLLPTGQISVDTQTDERQEQVAGLLEAIARSRPGPTPSVTLRYWVLEGGGATTEGGPVPELLDGVVRELETAYGEIDFRVLDVATVTGRAGRQALFESDQLEIMQTANANEDQLNAQILLGHDQQELSTDVSLARGEFLVLSSGTTSDGVIAVIVNWP